MLALTICQPFAWLIALPEDDPRHKRIENRSWRCHYRGSLAIHAGMGRSYLGAFPAPELLLVFGAIIATATVVDCLSWSEISELPTTHRLAWTKTHMHREGPYCIILQDVRRLARPVPCKGAQMLWSVPTEVERQFEYIAAQECR